MLTVYARADLGYAPQQRNGCKTMLRQYLEDNNLCGKSKEKCNAAISHTCTDGAVLCVKPKQASQVMRLLQQEFWIHRKPWFMSEVNGDTPESTARWFADVDIVFDPQQIPEHEILGGALMERTRMCIETFLRQHVTDARRTGRVEVFAAHNAVVRACDADPDREFVPQAAAKCGWHFHAPGLVVTLQTMTEMSNELCYVLGQQVCGSDVGATGIPGKLFLDFDVQVYQPGSANLRMLWAHRATKCLHGGVRMQPHLCDTCRGVPYVIDHSKGYYVPAHSDLNWYREAMDKYDADSVTELFSTMSYCNLKPSSMWFVYKTNGFSGATKYVIKKKPGPGKGANNKPTYRVVDENSTVMGQHKSTAGVAQNEYGRAIVVTRDGGGAPNNAMLDTVQEAIQNLLVKEYIEQHNLEEARRLPRQIWGGVIVKEMSLFKFEADKPGVNFEATGQKRRRGDAPHQQKDVRYGLTILISGSGAKNCLVKGSAHTSADAYFVLHNFPADAKKVVVLQRCGSKKTRPQSSLGVLRRTQRGLTTKNKKCSNYSVPLFVQKKYVQGLHSVLQTLIAQSVDQTVDQTVD